MKSHQKLATCLAALIIALAVFFLHNLASDWVRLSWRKAISWHINPWIFVGLLFATLFHYYKSWFQIARGLLHRDRTTFFRGVALNRSIWAIPYMYVLLFGRGYPWWVPAGIGAWMMIGIATFVRNVRKPEYVSRMTHSWVGRVTLRLMHKDPDENEEKDL